jgi:serine/threonine protein kinase
MKDYNELRDRAVDIGWNYCPMKSSDFQNLPRVDATLVETEAQIGPYMLQDRLGQGEFSVVCSGFKNKESDSSSLPLGAAVAVKSIDKRAIPDIGGIIKVENEVRALKALNGSREKDLDVFGSTHRNHDIDKIGRVNIIRFHEVLHGPRCLHIVTECMPLDLYTFMQQFRIRISEHVTAVIVRDVTAGLFHLQQHGIVHRDLKPENVLVAVGRHDIQVSLLDSSIIHTVQSYNICKELIFPILFHLSLF